MSADEAMEQVVEVYLPIWYVEYEVPEIVPRLRTYEKKDYLDALFDKDQEFVDKLLANPELLQRLQQGLHEESDSEPANLMDQTIEAALLNRAEFATCQLSRAVVTEPYVVNADEKKSIVHAVFQELCQSVELLEAWGSEKTLESLKEKVESFSEVFRLRNLVGLDLLNETEGRS